MNLFPRTLAVRTLLLVFAAVLLAEGITLWVAGYYRRSFFLSERADMIVRNVKTFRAAFSALSPDALERFLESSERDTGVRVLARELAHENERQFGRRFVGDVARRVRAELGDDTPIRFRRRDGAPALWVGFESGARKLWLVLPAARFEQPPVPWGLIVTLAAIVGLVLGLSAAFILGITRPLRRLNEATAALGAGTPRPVVPTGPRELRALAETFNHMLEKLDASERERGVMLAGLPHDLRAPLARMKLRVEMLDDREVQSGFRRDVEDVEHIAEQFVQYLRGLDPASLRRDRVDLADLARERASRYSALGKDVRFAGAARSVSGDRDALARALDNLIDNALAHGAPPVEIETRSEGAAALLVVRDSGPGIAEADRARALEPFTQLDPSRGTKGNVGLGLAIVQAIAKAHGGRLELATGASGGLEARIFLPSV